jgi:hypothetical protein
MNYCHVKNDRNYALLNVPTSFIAHSVKHINVWTFNSSLRNNLHFAREIFKFILLQCRHLSIYSILMAVGINLSFNELQK